MPLQIAHYEAAGLLEVVLKSHIKVKGVSSVSKADAYERTAAWKRESEEKQIRVEVLHLIARRIILNFVCNNL